MPWKTVQQRQGTRVGRLGGMEASDHSGLFLRFYSSFPDRSSGACVNMRTRASLKAQQNKTPGECQHSTSPRKYEVPVWYDVALFLGVHNTIQDVLIQPAEL